MEFYSRATYEYETTAKSHIKCSLLSHQNQPGKLKKKGHSMHFNSSASESLLGELVLIGWWLQATQ